MHPPTEATLKAELKFMFPNSSEQTHSRSFSLPRMTTEGGPQLLAAELFVEISKDLRFGTHWDALPKLEDLLTHPVGETTLTAQAVEDGITLRAHNIGEVWREVTN